jgi:sulfite exporter TauE/SafE
MVGTIGPIVYGERKSGKLPITLWIHTLGYVSGGTSLGLLLGVIGAALSRSIFPGHILLITGFVGLILSARDLDLLSVPVPQFRKQVPPKWLIVFPPRFTAFLFGAVLGSGVLTYIAASTLYLVVLWVTLSGSPLIGALGMAVFGLGRALPMVWNGSRNGFSNSVYLGRALPGWKPLMQLINGLALAFSGACLLVTSFTQP